MSWLPTVTPFTVVLSPAPPELAGGSRAAALPLDEVRTFAPFVAIGEPGRHHSLLRVGDFGDTPPVALVALDADLPARLDALMRLWRRLNFGRSDPPGELTPQRRQRLVLTLRALDAHLDGASTREVAGGLFGAERLPSGAEWKAHDLRSRAKRLIGTGRALMRGGYRALLRPPR